MITTRARTMKRILCYGDSNTWGYDPATQERFDRATRWTGVLRTTLGDGYEILEEGLNGRTTVWDDPIEGYKNGHTYLVPCLETHRPVDLVVLMLGTNDLKKRFRRLESRMPQPGRCHHPAQSAEHARVVVNEDDRGGTGRHERS